MPFHNLQQISDELDRLGALAGKEDENAARFLVSQIQPLSDRLTSLEKAAKDLADRLAKIGA